MTLDATSDKQLQELIEAELLNDDRVSFSNITVAVAEGIAKLTGNVTSFRRKLAAQQIVSAYDGIRMVQNELTVEPQHPTSDEEVLDTVRTVLDASADVTKKTVVVEVTGGKVTLTGKVASHWERVVAEDIARGVRGVREVTNMLVIDRAQKISDHELMISVHAALSRARGVGSADVDVAIGADTVVLSGSVDEPWQREVAETVVARFGLLHIRNQIHVTD